MKRILALLLVVFTLTSFTSCGTDPSVNNKTETDTGTKAITQAKTETETETEVETESKTETKAESQTEESSALPPTETPEAPVKEPEYIEPEAAPQAPSNYQQPAYVAPEPDPAPQPEPQPEPQPQPVEYPPENPPENSENQMVVYVTPTGKRYHYANPCGNGKYSPATLEQALKRGLTPCQKCVLH